MFPTWEHDGWVFSKVDDDDDDGFSITRETTHTTVVYRASSQRCINVSRINGTRRVASHRNAKFFCPLPLLRPLSPFLLLLVTCSFFVVKQGIFIYFLFFIYLFISLFLISRFLYG